LSSEAISIPKETNDLFLVKLSEGGN